MLLILSFHGAPLITFALLDVKKLWQISHIRYEYSQKMEPERWVLKNEIQIIEVWIKEVWLSKVQLYNWHIFCFPVDASVLCDPMSFKWIIYSCMPVGCQSLNGRIHWYQLLPDNGWTKKMLNKGTVTKLPLVTSIFKVHAEFELLHTNALLSNISMLILHTVL